MNLPNVERVDKIKTIFSKNDYQRMLHELNHFRPNIRCNTDQILYKLETNGHYESFQTTHNKYRRYRNLPYSRVSLCVKVIKKFNKTTYSIKHFDGLL